MSNATKRRHMFKMIEQAKNTHVLSGFTQTEALVNHNPAMIFSKEGQLYRWVKTPTKAEERFDGCCGSQSNTKIEKDHIFIDKFEAFESRLHDNLEVRRRAISNWKKLRILILMLGLCGGRLADSHDLGSTTRHIKKLEGEKKGCRAKFAPYIIDPMNKYKILWDILMGILYQLAYIIDPVILAFEFRPLLIAGINNYQRAISFIIIIDMLLVPFTGVPRED